MNILNLNSVIGNLESCWNEESFMIIDRGNVWYKDSIEKEFYEDKLFDQGFDETQVSYILQEMGY